MIHIICCTNRNQSLSLEISKQYQNILSRKDQPSNIIDLRLLPSDFLISGLYEKAGTNKVFNEMLDSIETANKVVFIVPEYNGSFPGVLKIFIDGMPYPNPLKGKKGALVGISSGVQGAGLALSHLTDILNYCGMHILAQKPKLSKIEENMDDQFRLTNNLYLELLEEQVQELIRF